MLQPLAGGRGPPKLPLVLLLAPVAVAAAGAVGNCHSVLGCSVLKAACESAGRTCKSDARDGSRRSYVDGNSRAGAGGINCKGKVCICTTTRTVRRWPRPAAGPASPTQANPSRPAAQRRRRAHCPTGHGRQCSRRRPALLSVPCGQTPISWSIR